MIIKALQLHKPTDKTLSNAETIEFLESFRQLMVDVHGHRDQPEKHGDLQLNDVLVEPTEAKPSVLVS